MPHESVSPRPNAAVKQSPASKRSSITSCLRPRLWRSMQVAPTGLLADGTPTQGDAPCGRLPWAVLGRAFDAEMLPGRRRSQGRDTRCMLMSILSILSILSIEMPGPRQDAHTRARQFPSPRSGSSAESAKHTSPGQAALKARAAQGKTPIMPVFLGPFGPSRRS